jgi:dTDP-4-dehydrorhamnose reductase
MLRLMQERGSVSVVADQRGSPTSADSIARALWALAKRSDLTGILHWTDAGDTSWYEFACAIAEEALALGLLNSPPSVAPITTADYPTPARRPANSVLDTRDTAQRLGLSPQPWRQELRIVLERIKAAAGRT